MSSIVAMLWFMAGRLIPSACAYAESRPGPALRAASCRLPRRGPVLRQPLQIEDPADQVRLLLHAPPTSPSESPQSVPILGLPEQLLDQLPTALRESVARAARPHAHARVRRGAATCLDGDV